MRQPDSKLEKIKLRLEMLALVVGILVGLGGSVVGLIAWTESRSLNRLNVDLQQDNDEIKLNDFLVNEPSLSALWAKFPGETNVQEVARKKILLVASANENEYSRLCADSASLDLTPLTVQRLNDSIWAGNNFYDEKRIRLRRAYNVMRWISEQIEYAFDANQRKLLNSGDFQSWISKLDELCTHPLFLAVIQNEHDSNFPSPSYCDFVKQRILAQRQGPEILSLLYSNMLDASWANTVGNQPQP